MLRYHFVIDHHVQICKVRAGTVKRDFSASQEARSSQTLIPWESTPPNRQQPPPQPAKKLSGSEARLKAIQEALSGYQNLAPAAPPLSRSNEQNASNKRPSPATEIATERQAKKRILPKDWPSHGDPLVKPSLASPQYDMPSGSKRSTSSSTVPTAAPTKSKLPSIFLSQEQTQILKLVQDGESVFYTGSAGTGKSVLLREIIKCLRKKYSKNYDSVAITASTGIAACNIGGVTIHSFAGIGLGLEDADHLVAKIKKNKKAATRWARTKVLIVDEVSMVDGDLFDKLYTIASTLRKTEPFGGIQVIVTGDFFQLPPVTKGSAQTKFAFEAQTWKKTMKHTFNLTKVFRQSDQTFVDMLNEMRFGALSEKSIAKFRSLSREIDYDDGLGPTELFPHREQVDRSNSYRMGSLHTQEEIYTAYDGGSIQDQQQREKLLQNFMAPKRLTLRVDAQVMLIKNVDDMLVNGSMGRVLRFVDPNVYGTEQDDELMASAEGVVGGTNAAAKKQAGSLGNKKYPVVEFVVPHGRRRMLIQADSWKVELPTGEVQVSRSQLPLILAWAMSIHKSQGQTLDRVKVDLGKVFEKGQAYVALSRATSLEGLQVLNFDPKKVQAHPKVVAWSKTLSTIQDSTSRDS